MKFRTKAVHAGLEPDPSFGSVIPAVHQTSTFAQRAVGEFVEDYDYARSANPTRTQLEKALGELEGGQAVCFSSGMAASHAVLMSLLKTGDHIVMPQDLYGGTYRLVDKLFKPWGLEYDLVDQSSLRDFSSVLKPNTRMIWIETPTNPLLNTVDLKRLLKGLPEGITTVVDNTFATPVYQRPLELGANLVVHSTTKYLGGHSDVVGGVAIASNEELYKKLRFIQNAVGSVPGPWDAFLTHRGLRTLYLRMRAHSENAQKIVSFLEKQPEVSGIRYPGYSGMVSFSHPRAREIAGKTKLFTLAESLGGVESLIELPQAMTHQSVEGSAAAVPADLVRLSVGIEDAEDLIADLKQAMSP